MDKIRVEDTYTKPLREEGPRFWSLQNSFYDWTRSVGIGSDGTYWTRMGDIPTYWSREQFRAFVAKNPDRPDIWKFQVGAICSPLYSGGTDGRDADFFSFGNVWPAIVYVFGTLLLAAFGLPILLFLGFGPLALLAPFVPSIILWIRMGKRYRLMKSTWGRE